MEIKDSIVDAADVRTFVVPLLQILASFSVFDFETRLWSGAQVWPSTVTTFFYVHRQCTHWLGRRSLSVEFVHWYRRSEVYEDPTRRLRSLPATHRGRCWSPKPRRLRRQRRRRRRRLSNYAAAAAAWLEVPAAAIMAGLSPKCRQNSAKNNNKKSSNFVYIQAWLKSIDSISSIDSSKIKTWRHQCFLEHWRHRTRTEIPMFFTTD